MTTNSNGHESDTITVLAAAKVEAKAAKAAGWKFEPKTQEWTQVEGDTPKPPTPNTDLVNELHAKDTRLADFFNDTGKRSGTKRTTSTRVTMSDADIEKIVRDIVTQAGPAAASLTQSGIVKLFRAAGHSCKQERIKPVAVKVLGEREAKAPKTPKGKPAGTGVRKGIGADKRTKATKAAQKQVEGAIMDVLQGGSMADAERKVDAAVASVKRPSKPKKAAAKKGTPSASDIGKQHAAVKATDQRKRQVTPRPKASQARKTA